MGSSSRVIVVVAVSVTLLAATSLRAEEMLLAAMPSVGSSHSTPVQGYLGIMFHDVSDSSVNSLHLKDKHGAEIVMVDHDGPAGKAGLREHDVVLSVNGVAVDGEEQLRKMLRDIQPGKTILLYICRDGAERTVSATLSTREEVDRQARLQRYTVPIPADEANTAAPAPPPPPPAASSHSSMFSRSFMSGHLLSLSSVYTGAAVDAMGPQLADYFGVKDGSGLLVHSVEGNSPAAAAGLHAGDVVTRMNGNRVATEKDWTRALRDSKGKVITMTVVRDRHEQTMTMIPDGRKRSSVEAPPSGDMTSPLLMLR